MSQLQSHRGLFIGVVTLDLIYLVDRPPLANEKLAASDYTVSAGGPATNAAVAFSHLGNEAIVMGVLGMHPMAQLILTDLQQYGVTLNDLSPTLATPPPVSSIMVTEKTGDRAVVSLNAVRAQASANIPANSLQDVAVILIDGHQMAVGRTIAMEARSRGIPVVIDGGSWKPGFETVLPLADYVICSANFHPPHCQSPQDVAAYLLNLGVPHIAITQGQQPIQYWTVTSAGHIDVPIVTVVDTLGAGDIFHGAFCHAILREDFRDALAIAANIAAQSCQYFGTRRWMEEGRGESFE
ncbi:PfkB family carbohydrate kinase [Stenomitos frigidus]|uniref:Ribokinase n=1 Tax=Stenomitos frigidus ULC18 TaxID=2107698 RepID=A0A2T1E9J9_9CYAN|nr:PfkB family carbohydrate kinase [Stenomitos frigidus]PSB29427.1 ribokinase [Stenomitos frigidus ULC18]